MIMHVKSKKHRVRNRRKLKSCLWVDVKVMFIPNSFQRMFLVFVQKWRVKAEPYYAAISLLKDSSDLQWAAESTIAFVLIADV